MAGASGWLPDAGEIIRQLPTFRIERQLGQGSTGVVYLAEDVRMQRKVALKILAPALAGDELFRKRFNQESQRAAHLDHPNVVPVYDAGESEGLYYIVMRYVAGGDLRTLLDASGPLSLERVTSIITQIAAALDAAHAEGLIHRDVKPANILISGRKGQEHYYLGDFGITKHVSSGTSLTGTGQFIGTLDYIAPEQIQGKPVDGRADQYMLGCVLYQCLTGMVPFKREETAALLWAHVHDLPSPVTAQHPDLPLEVDRVMARAMAKQPEDRYTSCGELALALRAAIGQPFDGSGTLPPNVHASGPIPQPASSGMTSTYISPRRAPTPVKAPSLQRRRWWLIAGAALTLTLVGVLALVGVSSFLKARFPNKAEEALLASVPQALQQECKRDDAEQYPANIKASLICPSDQGANQVVFKRFTSPEALDGAYYRAVNSSGVNRDTGNCFAADQAEHSYTNNTGRLSGRVLCYHERGSSYIMWTESKNQSPTLTAATRNDRDYAQLRDWWAGVIDRQVSAPQPKPPSSASSPTPVPEAAPPVREAAPPVREAAPPVREAAPPGPEAAPPVREAAPPGPEAAPPVPEAAPRAEVAPRPEATAPSGSQAITTSTFVDVATLLCLDSNTSGNVYTLDCNEGNFQNWEFAGSGTTTTIRNVSTGLCLDSNTSGNVYTLDCNEGNFQNWVVSDSGGIVRNFATGLCLDSNTSGNVYTLDCNEGNFQNWKHR